MHEFLTAVQPIAIIIAVTYVFRQLREISKSVERIEERLDNMDNRGR